MSFMPSPGSVVRLTSGEIGTVIKVTTDGKDDRVAVIRETWGKPVTKEVRITTNQITEIIKEVEMSNALDIFPLYEMIVDGKSEWHTLRDAGIVYDFGHLPISIGGQVLDGPGMTRVITEEERQKIADIADEWSASK